MRLRPRESGFSTFTLERPAALFRDAQSNMAEKIAPSLRRTGQQLSQGMKSTAHAVRAGLRRTAAHVRQTIASLYERSMPWLRQTESRLRARLRSAIDVLIPWLVRTQAQVRQGTRTFATTAAPRLKLTRERIEERTVSTVDSLRPWFTQARQHGHRRIEALREAADAKRKAGVPIWATVVLVIVTALVAQAVAHRSFEGRHELETRQLGQVHKAEQAAAQARAADALIRESDETHRLLGTTIAWTIASALSRKKDNELELYLHELTKNEQIELVIFADPKGKITLASNSTLKGTDFQQHFPAALLREVAVSIHRGTGATNRLVMPVHRFGTRLGTAMLVYKAR